MILLSLSSIEELHGFVCRWEKVEVGTETFQENVEIKSKDGAVEFSCGSFRDGTIEVSSLDGLIEGFDDGTVEGMSVGDSINIIGVCRDGNCDGPTDGMIEISDLEDIIDGFKDNATEGFSVDDSDNVADVCRDGIVDGFLNPFISWDGFEEDTISGGDDLESVGIGEVSLFFTLEVTKSMGKEGWEGMKDCEKFVGDNDGAECFETSGPEWNVGVLVVSFKEGDLVDILKTISKASSQLLISPIMVRWFVWTCLSGNVSESCDFDTLDLESLVLDVLEVE